MYFFFKVHTTALEICTKYASWNIMYVTTNYVGTYIDTQEHTYLYVLKDFF